MENYLYELATEDEPKNKGFIEDFFKLICCGMIFTGLFFMGLTFVEYMK